MTTGSGLLLIVLYLFVLIVTGLEVFSVLLFDAKVPVKPWSINWMWLPIGVQVWMSLKFSSPKGRFRKE